MPPSRGICPFLRVLGQKKSPSRVENREIFFSTLWDDGALTWINALVFMEIRVIDMQQKKV